LSRNHSNHAESDDYGDNFVGVGAKYDDYCDHGDQRPDFEYGADESIYTTINPKSYKVSENVHFDVVLEKYNPFTKTWLPTQSDDLVFDMTMLHSFIRFPIELTSKSVTNAKKTSMLSDRSDFDANMPVEITVPDTMGVYRVSLSTCDAFSSQFGSGVSFLSTQDAPINIPVRPYEHSEWARFLFVAYPYYLTMIITMVSFFIFSVAFLYTK
jgi:oligosaccharyltransferase complex subunit beta